MCTIGYGDISPITPYEQILCIITMLTASGMFGYSINTIGNIFSELSKQSEDIRKNMYIINNFMSIKQISKDL